MVGGGNLATAFVPLDIGQLMMPLALFLCGAGRYSIDAKLAERKRTHLKVK